MTNHEHASLARTLAQISTLLKLSVSIFAAAVFFMCVHLLSLQRQLDTTSTSVHNLLAWCVTVQGQMSAAGMNPPPVEIVQTGERVETGEGIETGEHIETGE